MPARMPLLKATDVNSAFLFSKEYFLADIVLANGKIIIRK
jgi:hypothetical protein